MARCFFSLSLSHKYLRCLQKHAVRDVMGARCNSSKSHAWEHVGVVTLAWDEHLAVHLYGVEGTATGENTAPLVGEFAIKVRICNMVLMSLNWKH